MKFSVVYLVLLFLTPTILLAQDEPTGLSRITSFPTRFLDKVQKQSAAMEEKIIADSEKALKKLAKQEARMKKKLARKDSLKAEQVFGNVEEKYAALQRKLEEPAELTKKGGQYIPQLDSLKTSLKFLSSTKDLLPENPALTGKIQDALGSVNGMQGKLQQAEQIKKILRDRRQQLKEQLSNLGMMKELKKYNQQAYYYGQQLQEYKNMLEDPGKLTEKALGLIQKLPAFQDFFKKNSELAGLFRLPDNSGTPQSLAGLQTRASVQSLIQDRIAAGGPNAQAMLQQNLQAAQSQLSQLKDKLNDLGGAGADGDMPDFKPNTQKTKSFLKRLEYGTNVQSAKSTSFFPTTTDIGLSVGYKLSDKSIIGVGASYKVGWGSDIRNISMSSEGVGLRSFLDVKLKGSFFASGGFEYNYQQPFNSIGQIKALDGWQQSGLLGISKIVSLKSKTFKKTRLQLFWDFLSYQQLPQTQAIKFRVGYNF